MSNYEIKLIKRRKRHNDWYGELDSIMYREVAASSALEALQKVIVDEDFNWQNFGVEVRRKAKA